MVKAMDFAVPEVNISVTIIDITNDGLKELGIDWQLPQVTISETKGNGMGFGGFNRSPLSFPATLKAMITQNKAKLLATPSISVMDGQQAYVLVGQKLNFPVVVQYTQAGSPVFSNREERVGIYLQASVWITRDNKVKLQLYPQVSTVSGFANINGGSYPQIATRECQTAMTIESGKTVFIGGLIHDSDITNIQKVPFLSSIPILGEFFSRTSKTHNRDQVMISITPTITYPEGTYVAKKPATDSNPKS
jgi:type II secretory pathway component GspD/PulD (secretin)